MKQSNKPTESKKLKRKTRTGQNMTPKLMNSVILNMLF